MPIDFKSLDTVSIQFDLGLPSLLVHESICQRAACFSILDEMVPKNCSCTPFVDFCLLPPIVTFDRELSHTQSNRGTTYCVMLDATKAFDRVLAGEELVGIVHLVTPS